MRNLWLALCLSLGLAPAQGQPFTMPPPAGIIVTAPYGKSTVQVKVTIAVTSTFQTALAASSLRLGCLIQNNGTHTMYVFFGTSTPADLTTSIQLAAGQAVQCSTATGGIATDLIQITGTSGDVAVVSSQ